ncbi:MAG: UvrD-helicase domain-containing protein [Planctomycetota bacterium]
MDILEGCTEAQRRAITHAGGALLVIAGAGSGKTRVVTRRIAYLLAAGVEGRAVLGITFTNKAAGEMTERVHALVGEAGVTLSTFHSFCARILRIYGGAVGIDRGFVIYDRDDRLRLLKEVLEEAGMSRSNWSPGKMEEVIGRAKSAFQSTEEYEEGARDFVRRQIAPIYRRYEERLQEANALDFDDLLVRAVRMCRDSPETLRALQDRYRHILVDEYQDTNHAQYLLIRMLAPQGQNLCVTGDPDQSIYGWRGAKISNILDFEKDYPDATEVKLEQNWRSTKNILAAADGVITRNRLRKDRGLWTENEEGMKVQCVLAADEQTEAEEVARRARELIASGTPPREIAVFYRTNALSRVYERGLRDGEVPYRIVAGTEFYERREVKDILAYLRLALNGADNLGFRRIHNVPARGIGKATIEKLARSARAAGVTLLAAAQKEAAQGQALPAGARRKLGEFLRILGEVRNAAEKGATAAIKAAIEASGYRKMLERSGTREDLERLENVEELLSAAAEFEAQRPGATAAEFLEQVALVSDTDEYDPKAGTVSLMTLHSAKGLEFDCVFMTAMEQGLLPHESSLQTLEEVEEERRLCYVGMTRARKRLVLSRVMRRTIEGKTRLQPESQFLEEIPPRCTETLDLTDRRRDDLGYVGGTDTVGESPYCIGDLVRHPEYGTGKVTRLFGVGRQLRVEVCFDTFGEVRFLVRHAALERVRRPFGEDAEP